MSNPHPGSDATQTLVPRCPPGRTNRKARAYSAEILRLRAQGYGLEAIREALADAGVHVSNSTVQREAARQAGRRPVTRPEAVAVNSPALPRCVTSARVADLLTRTKEQP
jgi:cytosine/adenosine deaminase-related metal-dependent hydrolase